MRPTLALLPSPLLGSAALEPLDETPPALAVPAIAVMLVGVALVIASPSRGTAAVVPAE